MCLFDYHRLDQQLLRTIAFDALVWSSLHGLVVGDSSFKVTLPPFSFLISLIPIACLQCIIFKPKSMDAGIRKRPWRGIGACSVCTVTDAVSPKPVETSLRIGSYIQ